MLTFSTIQSLKRNTNDNIITVTINRAILDRKKRVFKIHKLKILFLRLNLIINSSLFSDKSLFLGLFITSYVIFCTDLSIF